ncbi:tripartite tricarboxylate transporter substrate-binding protein [Achromobacter xylosoxidans]
MDSLAVLVAKAKAQPGALNFASAGRGNSTHLVVEMLARRSGITLTHVPYNGAAAGLTSVMADLTQVMADVLNTGLCRRMRARSCPWPWWAAGARPACPACRPWPNSA